MISYGRQDISEEDIEAVLEVLRGDYLTQGPRVGDFERAVANLVEAEHAVAVNSATSALHLACLALDIGQGDVVWTSPITFVASANCALYCRASIDFVDIDPASYNLSINRLADKLHDADRHGKLPKAVIAVHLCGQSCEMAAIKELADRYGFRVIEDASHAIGASYRTMPVGNCRYSDITIFSFHPVKIVTTGEGGMAITNDEVLADRMRRLRSHGITGAPEHMEARPADEIWNYQQIDLGFNYRITDIQAALGLSQLKRLDNFVAERRRIAHRYDQRLAHLPIVRPWQHPDAVSSYHLYPIRIAQRTGGPTQRDVYEALRSNGVQANLHYIPVYRQPFYERIGFPPGYCPEAERYHREAITIPLYPKLSSDDQDKVSALLEATLA